MEIKLQHPYKGEIVQVLHNHWRTSYQGILTYCAAPDGNQSAEWLSSLAVGDRVHFKATAPSTRTKGEFVGQLICPGNETPPKPITWVEHDNVRKRLRDWIASKTNQGAKLKKRNGDYSIVTHEGFQLTDPMPLSQLMAQTGFELKPHERMKSLF